MGRSVRAVSRRSPVPLLLLPVLAGAVLLTTLRLVELDAGWAVRGTAFVPYAFPAYLLVLLGVVVRLVRRRRGGAAPVAVAALVVVALAGLHAAWLAPLFVGGPGTPAAGASPVRVMSLNLLGGGADRPAVVRAVRDDDVDVLVLTEVRPGPLERLDEEGLGDALPHRIGEPAAWVEGTMVFSRFPLGEPTRLPTAYGGWAVDVETPDGPWRLLAVHPTAPLADTGAWSTDLAAVLAATRDGADAVVGDFNATEDHGPLRRLADAGFRSVGERLGQGWAPTWPADGQVRLGPVPLPRLVRIDHVLTGGSLAALDERRVAIPGTDHNGLLVTLAER